MHFLRPGRLIRIREGPYDWGWGVVVAVHQTGRVKAEVCLIIASGFLFRGYVGCVGLRALQVGPGICRGCVPHRLRQNRGLYILYRFRVRFERIM